MKLIASKKDLVASCNASTVNILFFAYYIYCVSFHESMSVIFLREFNFYQ